MFPIPSLGDMMQKKTQGTHCHTSPGAQFLFWSAWTISFTQLRIIWEGSLNWEMVRSDCPLGVLAWLFIDVDDMSSPLWVAPFPRQMVLGCIRKKVEHEPVSKPPRRITSFIISAVLPWLWLSFLGRGNAVWNIKQHSPHKFLLEVPVLSSLNNELWPGSVS